MSEEKKIKCLLPNFTKSRRKINKVIFLFNIFSIVNINVIYTFFFYLQDVPYISHMEYGIVRPGKKIYT